MKKIKEYRKDLKFFVILPVIGNKRLAVKKSIDVGRKKKGELSRILNRRNKEVQKKYDLKAAIAFVRKRKENFKRLNKKFKQWVIKFRKEWIGGILTKNKKKKKRIQRLKYYFEKAYIFKNKFLIFKRRKKRSLLKRKNKSIKINILNLNGVWRNFNIRKDLGRLEECYRVSVASRKVENTSLVSAKEIRNVIKLSMVLRLINSEISGLERIILFFKLGGKVNLLRLMMNYLILFREFNNKQIGARLFMKKNRRRLLFVKNDVLGLRLSNLNLNSYNFEELMYFMHKIGSKLIYRRENLKVYFMLLFFKGRKGFRKILDYVRYQAKYQQLKLRSFIASKTSKKNLVNMQKAKPKNMGIPLLNKVSIQKNKLYKVTHNRVMRFNAIQSYLLSRVTDERHKKTLVGVSYLRNLIGRDFWYMLIRNWGMSKKVYNSIALSVEGILVLCKGSMLMYHLIMQNIYKVYIDEVVADIKEMLLIYLNIYREVQKALKPLNVELFERNIADNYGLLCGKSVSRIDRDYFRSLKLVYNRKDLKSEMYWRILKRVYAMVSLKDLRLKYGTLENIEEYNKIFIIYIEKAFKMVAKELESGISALNGDLNDFKRCIVEQFSIDDVMAVKTLKSIKAIGWLSLFGGREIASYSVGFVDGVIKEYEFAKNSFLLRLYLIRNKLLYKTIKKRNFKKVGKDRILYLYNIKKAMEGDIYKYLGVNYNIKFKLMLRLNITAELLCEYILLRVRKRDQIKSILGDIKRKLHLWTKDRLQLLEQQQGREIVYIKQKKRGKRVYDNFVTIDKMIYKNIKNSTDFVVDKWRMGTKYGRGQGMREMLLTKKTVELGDLELENMKKICKTKLEGSREPHEEIARKAKAIVMFAALTREYLKGIGRLFVDGHLKKVNNRVSQLRSKISLKDYKLSGVVRLPVIYTQDGFLIFKIQGKQNLKLMLLLCCIIFCKGSGRLFKLPLKENFITYNLKNLNKQWFSMSKSSRGISRMYMEKGLEMLCLGNYSAFEKYSGSWSNKNFILEAMSKSLSWSSLKSLEKDFNGKELLLLKKIKESSFSELKLVQDIRLKCRNSLMKLTFRSKSKSKSKLKLKSEATLKESKKFWLNLGEMLLGYKIECKGMFKRKHKRRTQKYIIKGGMYSINRRAENVEYIMKGITLRTSACSVRVWLLKKTENIYNSNSN